VSYKRPPDHLARILDAAPTPGVEPSPDGSRLLLIEPEPNPPVALLARPYLALAGVRVDPETGGLRSTARIASLRILPVDGGDAVPLRLPDDRSFGVPVWSPDGRWLALVRHAAGGAGAAKELWLADAATGEAQAIPGLGVTDTLTGPMWTPDVMPLLGQPLPMLRWDPAGRLLAAEVPAGRPPLARAAMPDGPHVEEVDGKRAQRQTFQDLLTTAEDDRLFEIAATSRVVRIDPATGAVERLGEPALLSRFEPSPDGRWLLIERHLQPFSHRVVWSDFACRIEVWDAATGRFAALVAERPAGDEVPRHGVPTGPRGVRWLANRDATLTWLEALDGGDPMVEAPHRDRLVRWDAPFAGEPAEALPLRHRGTDRLWLAAPGRLLLTEVERERRWRTTWLVDLADPGSRRVLFDRSVNDAYGDPGKPLTVLQPSGHAVVRQDGGAIFLAGAGASREGARPFLDRCDLATGETERLFQSAADAYERFVCFAGPAHDRIVIERESPTEPPNLYAVSLPGGRRQLTRHADPHPELAGSTTRLIRYERDDGVPLSGTLCLPPGWRPGGPPLPLLLWAYPLDYSDPATAGQVRGSERTFTRIEGASPLWLLLRGWAVLTASMPIVGHPDTMNDTFVDQVVASARAAIDALATSGVVDRGRVVVSGHSYGGFMTATLLAHSDLFAAGIARSGAYNRTLTPFGFQTERRSYWEAPDVYHRVSPFAHADRIRAPLLLVHGAMDSNSGTYPVQSERLFQAIQGHGGTARLVVLPFEDHAYRGRESVLHVVAEMLDWTDRYAAPRD
jgi:dipeptidyl aminopeptidase/acylaminoacyl peptidase